ncbi:MAG: DUF411 domain-containing protein [Betaproteobacteria bacterium]
MRRRSFLGIAVATTFVGKRGVAAAATPDVDVYRSPTCGCCGQWVKHMRANGFTVIVHDVADVDAFRTKIGVPPAYASCHTAIVGGYVVEGHVPAADVRRLLAERPKALGLAVPGMPASAPGMDNLGAIPYEVLLIQADGVARNYHGYP